VHQRQLPPAARGELPRPPDRPQEGDRLGARARRRVRRRPRGGVRGRELGRRAHGGDGRPDAQRPRIPARVRARRHVVSAAITQYGYLGNYYGQGTNSSPGAYIAADAPPFFVAQGDRDSYSPRFVEIARGFTEKLRSGSSGPVVYAELPGAQHSFDLFTRSSLRRSSTASRTSPPGCAPTRVGLCEQRHEEETAALAGVSGLPGRPVLKAGRPRMCGTSLCPATTVTPARGSTRLSRPPCGEPRPRSGSPAQLGADASFPMKRNSESPAQAPSGLRRGARPSGRRSRPSLPSRARSPRAAVPRRFGSSASRCGRRRGL
jgi:hypothetical protein